MAKGSSAAVLIFSVAPDRKLAQRIADELVNRKLAGCVKIMSPCESTYTWRGRTVRGKTEFPLMIFTTEHSAADARAALIEIHPFEVVEAVVVRSSDVDRKFAEWLDACTEPEK